MVGDGRVQIMESWADTRLMEVRALNELDQPIQIPAEYMDRLVTMKEYRKYFRSLSSLEAEALFGDYQVPLD